MTVERGNLFSEVIIIGAGPGGLSVASNLKLANVDHLILEQGAEVGFSWSKMPESMQLISTLSLSILANHRKEFIATENKYLTKNEFLDYLKAYQRYFQLIILYGKKVMRVRREENAGYVLEMSDGSMARCKYLVNATGYFSNPNRPYGGMQCSIPVLHYAEYESVKNTIKKFPGLRKVLIIGKRISAGNLLKEFYKEGLDVFISCNKPISFIPVRGMGRLIYNLYFLCIHLLRKYSLLRDFDVKPVMLGDEAKELIEQGKVGIFPRIKTIRGRTVHFENGGHEEFDLIMLATGFEYELAHLDQIITTEDLKQMMSSASLEHLGKKNFFIIGHSGLRDDFSRFLIGIRRDSQLVAKKIIKRTKDG